MKHVRRSYYLLIALTGMLLVTGCGGDAYDLVPVSGRVTYDDGTLLPSENNYVRLTFYPQAAPLDERTHPRPATADVDLADGTFTFASTHNYADGITTGRHKVVLSTIVAQEVPRGVPAEYNDLATTPLEVDASDAPFHLRIRRP